MKTDDLIAALAENASPVSATGPRDRLIGASLAGAVAAIAVALLWLGLRPDIHIAMRTSAFWMKLGYALVLALCGFGLTLRMGRPGARPGAGLVAAPAAFGLLAVLAVIELVLAPAGQRPADWLGQSWDLCPVRILIIAAPAYLVIVWGLRGMAPTRLGEAGAAAGLLAGGLAAMAYGLYCQETTAAFLATWYTLGVVLCGAVGALAGPRLLRW